MANLISVVVTMIRLILLKLFHYNSLYFYLIERFSPDVVIELSGKGKMIFGKKVRIHSGCKIKVRKKGILSIGDNTKINYNCIMVCHEKIEIGNNVEFGPNVLIYDHDHVVVKGMGIIQGAFNTSQVSIGDNTWIGAGTIILKGTSIGSNCVIGAGSVIKGDVKSNSIVIQKRNSEIHCIDDPKKN